MQNTITSEQTVTTLPSVSGYGQYSSDNYGVNALLFSLGAIDVYFSYKTPVAFRHNGRLTVRRNDWGPTTGKHLTWIDGGSKTAKAARVEGREFEQALCDVLRSHNLSL
jgi:hypothetical protein